MACRLANRTAWLMIRPVILSFTLPSDWESTMTGRGPLFASGCSSTIPKLLPRSPSAWHPECSRRAQCSSFLLRRPEETWAQQVRPQGKQLIVVATPKRSAE